MAAALDFRCGYSIELGVVKIILFIVVAAAVSQGAVRPIPAPGISMEPAERLELSNGVGRLAKAVHTLRAGTAFQKRYVADVEVYYKAIDWALRYNEIYKPEEVQKSREMLWDGLERADQLLAGEAPWTKRGGLVVRGYRSNLDDSVQPYGLVLPRGYSPDSPHRWRLDAWFHGRGETLTELNFIHDRTSKPGEFAPDNAIVVHLYGRYCNANKFAGEVDLFEALAAIKRDYKIDPNRIAVRGFSMGGAATWHLAAHHAGLWAAAAPGAGFADTAEYQNLAAKGARKPWYEEKLWRMTNATDYAENFFNLPVVAYSGEIDKQIQAANVMAREMAKEGVTLTHIIGPQTAHKYHADSKPQIEERITALVQRGREVTPREIRFTTYTLKYSSMKWVVAEGMKEHWERARVHAKITGASGVDVKTENLTRLKLQMGPAEAPFSAGEKVAVKLDGKTLMANAPQTDRSWVVRLERDAAGEWQIIDRFPLTIRKKHDLQGPIDDAFMSRFIFVRPTGSGPLDAWAKLEMEHALNQWRSQWRGEAIVKNDTDVTPEDMKSANLILWGDPQSNKLIAKYANAVPVKFPGGTQALIAIYPNPDSPNRYVVFNSGATMREFHYLTNADQTPKLPDWATVDTSVPADDKNPGRITGAGFFDEVWALKKNQAKSD